MSNQILSGTYEIKEQLGSGGGGIVYKAWHNRLQKDVVLKEIKGGAASSLAYRRAEADILKTLKHSYLPALYDFVEEGDRVYTVIDFIPGQSFDRLLKDGKRYSQKEVIVWARQLLEALTYLHGQRPPILHSDIKPANVMLTPDGDICLIDFNISLMLGDDGAVAIGRSHGYASPEQYGPGPTGTTHVPRREKDMAAQSNETVLLTDPLPPGSEKTELLAGSEQTVLLDPNTVLAPRPELLIDNPPPRGTQPALLIDQPARPAQPPPAAALGNSYGTASATIRLDVRSDIYSVGATLYHMLTGERPNRDARQVKPLASFGLPLSEALVYIIEKAMKPNPTDRFQTAAQMLHAVRNIQRLDRRWKAQTARRYITAGALTLLFCVSVWTAYQGTIVLAQEKEDLYHTLVQQIEESSAQPQDAAFTHATELFPGRINAYHAQAKSLAELGDFEQLRAFVSQSLPFLRLEAESANELHMLGDLYFLLANTYFETEDYANAIQYYKAAVDANQSNPEYYRDYAIATARTGDVDTAQSLLETAERLNLGADSLDLLRGEIAFVKGALAQAVDFFHSCIRLSGDEYIRYRAYRICSDVYKRSGQYDDEIALLTAAQSTLPAQYINEVLERLGDAYVRGGQSDESVRSNYYTAAIDCFEDLLGRGYGTFHIRQNLAILYHQTEQWAQAETLLTALQEDFPDDYRVPMRLAYLYADMEAAKKNEQRDYSQTKAYFDSAWALYQDQQKAGLNDPEMQMLSELIGQLAQGGWFK